MLTAPRFKFYTGLCTAYVENGILHDDDDETLTNTTDEQIMRFSEFIFPFLRNIQLKSLRHYEGASLCLK